MHVHKKIFLMLTALFSTLCSMTTKAGKESCPVDAVHCAYFSGLSENLNDGRFVKIQHGNYDSFTVCFTGRVTIFMNKDGAEKNQGNNTSAYSICTDNSGTNCEQIGVDNFVITKRNNDYLAEPKYFELDLSTLKNKYSACKSPGLRVGLNIKFYIQPNKLFIH